MIPHPCLNPDVKWHAVADLFVELRLTFVDEIVPHVGLALTNPWVGIRGLFGLLRQCESGFGNTHFVFIRTRGDAGNLRAIDVAAVEIHFGVAVRRILLEDSIKDNEGLEEFLP